MAAPQLRAVDDLNQRALEVLRPHRQVGPDVIRVGKRAPALGDEVLALRNDYRLGVLNGTRGVEIDMATSTSRSACADKGPWHPVRLPRHRRPRPLRRRQLATHQVQPPPT